MALSYTYTMADLPQIFTNLLQFLSRYFAVQLITYSSVNPFISAVRYSEVLKFSYLNHFYLLPTMHAFSIAQLSTK